MTLSRRYTPSFAEGESSVVGYDLSFLVPPGVGIAAGSLAVWTNTVAPVESSDFTIGTVGWRGRTLYARLSGGVDGTDYQLRWTATDTNGNVWPRTGLMLCADTS